MSPSDATRDTCTVESSVASDCTRIKVTGELDALSAPEVHAAIESAAAGDVEVDLGDVTFIDSSGLAAVIEGHIRLAPQQRRLVLVDRSPVVQRLLDLSGVSTQLDLDP